MKSFRSVMGLVLVIGTSVAAGRALSGQPRSRQPPQQIPRRHPRHHFQRTFTRIPETASRPSIATIWTMPGRNSSTQKLRRIYSVRAPSASIANPSLKTWRQ